MANSNSEIVITIIKLVLSQKLVFDFEIILTLDELVLSQILTIVITIIKLVLSQKLVFDSAQV